MNLPVPHAQLAALAERVAHLAPAQALALLAAEYPGQVAMSTSFGLEDQLLTYWVAEGGLPIRVFTLDTGRLFEATYKTWSATLDHYGIAIEAYHPQPTAVEALLAAKGPHSFYASIENRKECCYIRKVEPLARALAGTAVWVTGIRAEQSPNRADMALVEWDPAHGLIKYNPLLHYSEAEVWAQVRAHTIPYNVLHDRGYPSIGCEPCTRAVAPGADPRSGRWWWEANTNRECGLHSSTPATETEPATHPHAR